LSHYCTVKQKDSP